MSFRIWKWNNPNRKWNYLSNNIQISDQKTFYKNKKSFPFGLSYIMLGVTPYVLFGLSCSLCVTHYVLLLLVTHYVFLVICYMFDVTCYMLLVRCHKIILGVDRLWLEIVRCFKKVVSSRSCSATRNFF